MSASQNKPFIAIVKPKLVTHDPTKYTKSVLEKAGFEVTVWDEVVQAQRALLGEAQQAKHTRRDVIVIVVDEILPNESGYTDEFGGYRDGFVDWLHTALMVYPCVIHIFTSDALAPFQTNKEYEAFADASSWAHKWFKGKPNPAELVQFIKTWTEGEP